MRLEDEVVRFTIIPDQGTQVWAQLPIVCFSVPLPICVLASNGRGLYKPFVPCGNNDVDNED